MALSWNPSAKACWIDPENRRRGGQFTRCQRPRHRIEHYNEVLSTLGLKLSSAVSADEAARIILEAADKLFGWDACTLNLYSPDEDKIYPIVSIDTVRGRREEIPQVEKWIQASDKHADAPHPDPGRGIDFT